MLQTRSVGFEINKTPRLKNGTDTMSFTNSARTSVNCSLQCVWSAHLTDMQACTQAKVPNSDQPQRLICCYVRKPLPQAYLSVVLSECFIRRWRQQSLNLLLCLRRHVNSRHVQAPLSSQLGFLRCQDCDTARQHRLVESKFRRDSSIKYTPPGRGRQHHEAKQSGVAAFGVLQVLVCSN